MKGNMKTYKNTFEIFGDPSPCEAESAEGYAAMILPLFEGRDGQYRVEKPMSVGNSNEVEWTRDVWNAAVEEAEARGETVEDDEEQLTISDEALLEYLLDSVEEVEEEK